MNHATEGLLLAYQDGEIDGPALAELRAHLASCAECTRELAELQRLDAQLHETLGLMDVAAPTLQTRAAIAATRRQAARPGGLRWLAAAGVGKAAVLLLALGGVVTAIPGTPARRALESVLARWFDRAAAPPVVEEPAASPAPTARELFIDPAGGRIRVLVNGATDVAVTVRLVDGEKASVKTAAFGQDVKLLSASGRAELSGLSDGTLVVEIPRRLRGATVEFNGAVYVRLRDGVLQARAPEGDARGDEVRFRVRQD